MAELGSVVWNSCRFLESIEMQTIPNCYINQKLISVILIFENNVTNTILGIQSIIRKLTNRTHPSLFWQTGKALSLPNHGEKQHHHLSCKEEYGLHINRSSYRIDTFVQQLDNQ
jgi:hypothetical protein